LLKLPRGGGGGTGIAKGGDASREHPTPPRPTRVQTGNKPCVV